jgi:antirestriction protein ArdC
MNVYEIITERITEKLEQGVVPWRVPWHGGQPKNLITKKDYRGINTFVLNAQGFESEYFLTYRQAQQAGGHVKKGEKGLPIVYWDKMEKVVEKDDEKTIEKIPFLRYYTVFNVTQCENINYPGRSFTPIMSCEKVVQDMPKRPEVVHQMQRAYYSPLQDYINLPRKHTFRSAEDYYSTLFHELGHATGHPSRLNRTSSSGNGRGSRGYAREELTAEMTSAFLCGKCGITMQSLDDAASYINSWLKVLNDDQRMVVMAAAQAQKAADYILGEQRSKSHERSKAVAQSQNRDEGRGLQR